MNQLKEIPTIYWNEIKGNCFNFTTNKLMLNSLGYKRLINCRSKFVDNSRKAKAVPHYVIFDRFFVRAKISHFLKEFSYVEKNELLNLVKESIEAL
jgi:hypothetical protein